MGEKANAPEKLYIDSREHWRKSWTAFTTKAEGYYIEYIRTYSFIEKACEWFEENFMNVHKWEIQLTSLKIQKV